MESIFVKLAQYPSIETERLLLRPVTLDDAEEMFDYASDRENTRYTFPTNQSLEETKNCLLYTSPSPRDRSVSRMPSSA